MSNTTVDVSTKLNLYGHRTKQRFLVSLQLGAQIKDTDNTQCQEAVVLQSDLEVIRKDTDLSAGEAGARRASYAFENAPCCHHLKYKHRDISCLLRKRG